MAFSVAAGVAGQRFSVDGLPASSPPHVRINGQPMDEPIRKHAVLNSPLRSGHGPPPAAPC